MAKVKANEFEAIVVMVSPIREPKGMCIVLEDDRDLLAIAQDFSGHEMFEVAEDYQDCVTVYQGYTQITSMYRRNGTVTLVLGKEN